MVEEVHDVPQGEEDYGVEAPEPEEQAPRMTEEARKKKKLDSLERRIKKLTKQNEKDQIRATPAAIKNKKKRLEVVVRSKINR